MKNLKFSFAESCRYSLSLLSIFIYHYECYILVNAKLMVVSWLIWVPVPGLESIYTLGKFSTMYNNSSKISGHWFLRKRTHFRDLEEFVQRHILNLVKQPRYSFIQKSLIIFAKSSILDDWEGSEYASACLLIPETSPFGMTRKL